MSSIERMKLYIQEKYKNVFTGKPHWPFQSLNINKATATATITTTTSLFLLFLFLFVGLFFFTRWIDLSSIFSDYSSEKSLNRTRNNLDEEVVPLACNAWNHTQTCPQTYRLGPTFKPGKKTYDSSSSKQTCPEYFRWIHEDLRYWRETGITREMVESANKTAHFRLVIKDGKAYVVKFRKPYQTRDLFTIWGIAQLLRLYPGRLPDLDMMFDCDDRPVVNAKYYNERPNLGPPPIFKYCSDWWSMDIVFPDWSFWGWPEINIKPWEKLLKDIEEGNKRTKWKDRVPYAYWKGNPHMSKTRANLMTCNVTNEAEWNARLFVQDWNTETLQGFKHSKIEDQCTYRYKIYVEGIGWSVSEKYILACNSPTLYIASHFYDFYIRGMVPLKHYWPIRDTNKCRALKFAVEWGNNNTEKAKAIGEAASRFMREDLKMENVYDYMFHLLNEYAKLLRYKPTVPSNAMELCSESMVCLADGNFNEFMRESLVRGRKGTPPCTMPPPYEPTELGVFWDEKAKRTKQVEAWENEYWNNLNKKQ